MSRNDNVSGKSGDLNRLCDLGSIVRDVYRNDVGKLAAWTSASHIEKPPKKAETPN